MADRGAASDEDDSYIESRWNAFGMQAACQGP